MNISHFFKLTALVLGLKSIVCAQSSELPDQAKRIVVQLEKFEERELVEAEEKILKKKQDLLKTLERYEKRVDEEWMKKLYGEQIASLKQGIAASEGVIRGDRAENIVNFDVVYHYNHPMEEHSAQRGEMTFTGNGKVKVLHIGATGGIAYEKEYVYVLVGGKLKLSDPFHGDVMVSKNGDAGGKKITVEWLGLKKVFTAEVK